MQDNQGALAITKNPVKHSRTKHIDIRYHFIRENLLKNEFNIEYCPTTHMIADIMTKSLGTQLFERFRGMMNITNVLQEKLFDKEQERVLFVSDENDVFLKSFSQGIYNGLDHCCCSTVEQDIGC